MPAKNFNLNSLELMVDRNGWYSSTRIFSDISQSNNLLHVHKIQYFSTKDLNIMHWCVYVSN